MSLSFAEFKRTRQDTGTLGAPDELNFAEFKKRKAQPIPTSMGSMRLSNLSPFGTQTTTPAILAPETPTIQGVARTFGREAGQSVMRNVASFVGSEALEPIVKPITQKASGLEKDSPFFKDFTDDLARRLYGDIEDLTQVEITGETRAEQIAPLGERTIKFEKRLEEKKKEYDELLKLPDISKRERAVLETLSKIIDKRKGELSPLIIGGLVGLDIIPGFGSSDDFFKAMIKTGDRVEAFNLLKKINVADDLAERFADNVIKVSNRKEAEKLFENIANLQQTTKQAKPTLDFASFKANKEFRGFDDLTTNGSSHFPNSKNYFAHARGDEVVEGGKKIWREQEIQSDLLQKDNLEKMKGDVFRQAQSDDESFAAIAKRIGGGDEIKGNSIIQDLNKKELAPLSPFTNDRFGERIMRERIREKAQKGYSKYRLPTGETVGRIEGFTETNKWWTQPVSSPLESRFRVAPDNVKIGQRIFNGYGEEWVVNQVIGEGRIKAIPRGTLVSDIRQKFPQITPKDIMSYLDNCL